MTDISSNFVGDNINATCTKYVIRFIMSGALCLSQPISVSLSLTRARALSLSRSHVMDPRDVDFEKLEYNLCFPTLLTD